jgi:hypothetical protein
MNSHDRANRVYPGISSVILVLQCPDPGFAATEYVSGARELKLKALIRRSGEFCSWRFGYSIGSPRVPHFTITKSCVSRYPHHRGNRIYPVSVQGIHGLYGMARPEIGI